MGSQYKFIVEFSTSIKDELIKKYGISRREYRRIKAKALVFVNSKSQKVTFPVNIGDKVEITINESPEIIPQKMDLKIIYEDDYLLLLDKPGNILVHPVRNERSNTLANGIMEYRDEKGENWGIHPVHRLDRETSGLVLFAKTSHIHNMMAEKLIQRSFKREYYALVEGLVHKRQGVIDLPIADTPVKKRIDPNGKEAITLYSIVKKYQKNTLLRLKLLTGRTHQIRIHLKALGHGIMGDSLYHQKSQLISRQALHAFKLKFTHPITLDEMTFTSKLPRDFKELLLNL